MNSQLELRLEKRDELGLELNLWNRSAESHAVLVNDDIQPSTLALSVGGKNATCFDERTRMKFDTSVSPGMYEVVEPGGAILLESATFQRDSSGYLLTWGPFRFAALSPGLWAAQARFESRIAYVTKHGSEQPVNKPVWLGALVSGTVHVQLP